MSKRIKASELWSLDDTLARFILVRLKAFRKMKKVGIPSPFRTMREWNTEINKMIYAFDKIVNPKNMKQGYFVFSNPKVKAGLKSFAENFGSLWD